MRCSLQITCVFLWRKTTPWHLSQQTFRYAYHAQIASSKQVQIWRPNPAPSCVPSYKEVIEAEICSLERSYMTYFTLELPALCRPHKWTSLSHSYSLIDTSMWILDVSTSVDIRRTKLLTSHAHMPYPKVYIEDKIWIPELTPLSIPSKTRQVII